MKNRFYILVLWVMILISFRAEGQNKDKAVFKEVKPGFLQNSILRDDREVKAKSEPAEVRKVFQVDLSNASLPNKVDLYKNQQWRNPPLSQGNTGTCWCFSTTSFLESEIYRMYHKEIKLSEMFTVYWEYVEKARRYIQERGNSAFEEGSEANAVPRIWKKYGTVPEEAYTGLLNDRKFHNHESMMKEMKGYLESLKTTNAWDEEVALATIRSILDHYLGVPPTEITVNGTKMVPLDYLNKVLKINPDDYVDILSYSQESYWQKVEYKVTDNWWHSREYCNVPLDAWIAALKGAVRKGFTVAIGGDTSEPGFDRATQCAVIPDFDIPSSYINDDARQFRFTNHTTTDDHGIHLLGYLEKDGKDWYLIKDSGSGSRGGDPNAREFGYYFFSEDYVKLKMMDFMVHKDAMKELLEKIK